MGENAVSNTDVVVAEQTAASERVVSGAVYGLVAGLSVTSVATLLSILMSVATNKIIAVSGGPESVALMGLFRNLGVLVTNVLSVGFGPMLVMQKLSVASGREATSRIIGAGALLLAVQLGAICLAIVALAHLFGAWIFASTPTPGQVLQVRVVLVMAFVNLALQLVTGILKGRTSFGLIATVPLVTSAASLAVILPLVRMGPIGLAVNVGSGGVIGTLVGAAFIVSIYQPRLRIADTPRYWEFLKTCMRPSVYLVIVTGAVAAGLLAAQTIVERFYGVEELGRYNAAMMIFDTSVMLLIASGRTYLVPMLARLPDERAKARLIRRVILALVAGSIAIAGGAALAGERLMSLLFSDRFVGGAGMLSALCLGLVGISVTYSLNAYLLHKEDIGTFVAIDVGWIGLIVAGTWLTARLGYGPVSAAWSYAVASWIAGGAYILAAHARHGLSLGSLKSVASPASP